GRDDLVSVGAYMSLAVHVGNGDGTFQDHVDYPAYYFPIAVAMGDLNGDQKPDVVVANAGGPFFSVWFGNGDGSLSPRVDYPTDDALNVVIPDLNGDGRQDLALSSSQGVRVMLGNGDGTFGPPSTSAAGGEMANIVVADFNGDAVPDLATSN